MTKKTVLSILAVFVTWSVLDYIIHGLILENAYQETAALWRPMDDMKMGLMYFTVLVAAASFVTIYALFITNKGINTAVKYGLVFGIGVGISMGYGSFSIMPIPYSMAFIWFLGSVVKATLGGLVAGAIIKKEA